MATLSCVVILWHLGLIVFTVSADCVDENSNCGYWTGVGECLFNPAYMDCACSLSCNTSSECTGGPEADRICQCSYQAAGGRCEHGSIANDSPFTCSLRQTVICDPPSSFPNAIAVGNRRYLDRVNYICRHGYRNNGNVGLRVCDDTGTWITSKDNIGTSPDCVADPSLLIPCQDLTFIPVARGTVKRVGILNSRQGYSVAECCTWCQRIPGCTHIADVSGKCILYYNTALSGSRIETGSVWKKTYHVEPVHYYDP